MFSCKHQFVSWQIVGEPLTLPTFNNPINFVKERLIKPDLCKFIGSVKIYVFKRSMYPCIYNNMIYS